MRRVLSLTLLLVCLTTASALVGWLEFALLRRGLRRHLGPVSLDARLQWKLWIAALLGAAAAWGTRSIAPASPWPRAIAVLGTFGLVYLGGALLLRVPEAQAAVARVARLLGRARSGV